jgi:hypothetical protein
MLNPCLGYDNQRNVYRLTAGANTTQTNVQKLTGDSTVFWQNVASFSTNATGTCYVEPNTFTFGILNELTGDGDGW